MSDTPTTPETPETPEVPEAPKQETFSREYVESLRQEAAQARVAKKTAVDEAKAEVIRDYEGKLADKDTAFTELQTTHGETSLELLKLKAIVAAKIPVDDIEDVVTLVQGTDEETVNASVERVKALLGKSPAKDRPVDPSQGKGSHIPLNGDPIVNMLNAALKG